MASISIHDLRYRTETSYYQRLEPLIVRLRKSYRQFSETVQVHEKEFFKLLSHALDITRAPRIRATVYPRKQDDRIQHLLKCVFLMVVDGEVDQDEFAICMGIAARMNLDPMMVKTILDDFIEWVKSQRSEEEQKEEKAAEELVSSIDSEIDRFLKTGT